MTFKEFQAIYGGQARGITDVSNDPDFVRNAKEFTYKCHEYWNCGREITKGWVEVANSRVSKTLFVATQSAYDTAIMDNL